MKADWLSQLAPDRAPPPPGWWPLAPGWWVLALLVLVSIVMGVLWYWRRHGTGPRRWQRVALKAVAQLETDGRDDATLARELQQLLRRYAVARYGRDSVARLSGQAWVDFVVTHGGAAWANDSGRLLLRHAYGGAAPAAPASVRDSWLAGARSFLKART